MTTTLQQALLKAGLISQDQLKKAEAEKKKAEREARRPPEPKQAQKDKKSPRREKTQPKKSVGFIEGKHHHHIRTACDACQKSSPDVEYYEHKNRSLEKNWLCVKCADTHNISDEFRQTMQSQFAKTGRFLREYGATKVFK